MHVTISEGYLREEDWGTLCNEQEVCEHSIGGLEMIP